MLRDVTKAVNLFNPSTHKHHQKETPYPKIEGLSLYLKYNY